jgi:putative phosphoesterase
LTKALIISDIHSNIYALEAIWAQERDSDLIFCAGDLVDYGPYPKEVVEWVRAREICCVQGNHDQFVAFCYRAGHTLDKVPAEDRAWVHHNASLLTEEDITFLEQLPQAAVFELDGITYGLTHLYQEYEEIVTLHAFAQFRGRTFAEDSDRIPRIILGHTHRQAIRYLSDTLLWLNPGSASYRRRDDPDQTAHYATITDGVMSLRRLTYNIEPLRRYVQQVSLQESEIRVVERMFGHREPPTEAMR